MMSVVDLRAFISHGPDGTVVLCLDGDLDRATASAFDELIAAALAAGAATVVVDLRDVGSVDEDGLRAIAHAHQRAAAVGGSVRLRSPSRRARDLLLMTGLDHTLAIDCL